MVFYECMMTAKNTAREFRFVAVVAAASRLHPFADLSTQCNFIELCYRCHVNAFI
jgi:hypothetical protein